MIKIVVLEHTEQLFCQFAFSSVISEKNIRNLGGLLWVFHINIRMKSRNDSQIIMVPTPRSQPSLVREFEGRRAGIIKALTTDFETFYEQCDPEKGPLRLFGLPNATWEVKPDVGQIPPEFPEPVLGINFLRDERQEKDWLSYVAVCSDAWLLSIVFYSVGLCGHEKETRKTLFDNINDLPTVLEVVTEAIQAKELAASAAAAAAAAAANNNRRLSRRLKNRQSKSQPESSNTSASTSRK